jgi:hypothetical protein
MTHDVAGLAVCESCGREEEARGRALGSALLTFVGVGYLLALSVGYVVFHARPFVGGLAAVLAIGLGRTLQLFAEPAVVTRRPREPDGVGAGEVDGRSGRQ